MKNLLDHIHRRLGTRGACSLWGLVYATFLSFFLICRAIWDLSESILWEVSLYQHHT